VGLGVVAKGCSIGADDGGRSLAHSYDEGVGGRRSRAMAEAWFDKALSAWAATRPSIEMLRMWQNAGMLDLDSYWPVEGRS
jgi:hypothetical protein